jgi:transposase
LRQDPVVEEAMGAQALRLLATLDTECASIDQLGQATAEAFAQHPDYQIITSFTGLGDMTGARVLAEIGDDRTRFADTRSLKAYAGSAPLTRASGRSLSITHRRVKNNRLAAAGFIWAFVAAAHSPGASALYYRRREHGDRHAAALRNVFNRLIGCLHHCLQTGQEYNETKAFPTQAAAPEPAAA